MMILRWLTYAKEYLTLYLGQKGLVIALMIGDARAVSKEQRVGIPKK
jgi:hypothetical protein|tara:strand:- start:368 stop:508 length:141 start_codon:yes stop_codon:yes gene_type:complete